jgi:hypothetical protein
VVWLAAHFAKFSALNTDELGMLKANSSATDIELRAGAVNEVGRAYDVRKPSERRPSARTAGCQALTATFNASARIPSTSRSFSLTNSGAVLIL